MLDSGLPPGQLLDYWAERVHVLVGYYVVGEAILLTPRQHLIDDAGDRTDEGTRHLEDALGGFNVPPVLGGVPLRGSVVIGGDVRRDDHAQFDLIKPGSSRLPYPLDLPGDGLWGPFLQIVRDRSVRQRLGQDADDVGLSPSDSQHPPAAGANEDRRPRTLCWLGERVETIH